MAHLYVRPATTSRLYQIICSKGQLSYAVVAVLFAAWLCILILII